MNEYKREISSPLNEETLVPTRLAGPGPTSNPFSNNTKELSVTQWLQLIILGPTVGIARVVLVMILVIVTIIWTNILLIGVKRLDKPLMKWRRFLLGPAYFNARAILFVLGFYHIKVKGKPAPAHIAPIMVSNHLSFIEPLFFSSYGFSHVAKQDLINTMMKPMVIVLQTLLVERTSKESMKNVKVALTKRAQETITGETKWTTLMIYPEGTTSNGNSLLQFKYGAFSAGVPVQPVVVKFKYHCFDPSWTWGSRFSELRMFCQFSQHMEVEFLAVHKPTAAEVENPKLFSEAVRRTMATKLNVPASECSAEDFLLGITASKWKIPPEVILIETMKMQQVLNLSSTDIRLYLEKFATLDTNKDGKLDFNDFKNAFGDSVSQSTVTKLFQKFDLNKTRHVHFREFVGLMIFLNDQISHEQTIEFAFQLIDLNNTNAVTHKQLLSVVKQYPHLNASDIETTVIPEMDATNSGTISRGQFVKYFQAHPEVLTGLNKTSVLHHFKGELDKQIFGQPKSKNI